MRQGNVIRAVPDPRAVVEPEYLVDPIAKRQETKGERKKDAFQQSKVSVSTADGWPPWMIGI